MALARALAPEPELVLLDEPFSSLDATLRADLRREVELILREAGATALLVTHDQEEALALGDRLAVMRDGRAGAGRAPRATCTRGPPTAGPRSSWARSTCWPGVADGARRRDRAGQLDLAAPGDGPGARGAATRAAASWSAGHDPNAEVVDREFRGHDVLYRLRHEGGRTLLVQLPSLELYEVGAQVFVRPGRRRPWRRWWTRLR